MWDAEAVAGDLELLRAFLQLRNPLDALLFGAAGGAYGEPTAEEIWKRARFFGFSAVKLGRDEAEIDELLLLIARRRDEALDQLGYTGSEDRPSASWFLTAERVAMAGPLVLAGLAGLVFYGVAGLLAGLVVQPQFVPVFRSLLFAAGFLGAFNRLFMPVPATVWIRAFAWLSLPPIAWITLWRLGQLSSAREVLNPGFLPIVPWAMAFLGICLGVRILRGAARREGLERTLIHFDPSIRWEVPAGVRALPGAPGLVRGTRTPRTYDGDTLRALLSLALVVIGVGSALWIEGSGTVQGMRDRELAARASAEKQRADAAAQAARKEQERRDEEERRRGEMEALEKAKAAEEKKVQELKEAVEREREEKARKQREIDRLKATAATPLDGPFVFFLSDDENPDPLRAKGLIHVALTEWEVLPAGPVGGRGNRAIIRGAYTKAGGDLVAFPQTLRAREGGPAGNGVISDEEEERAKKEMRSYAFTFKGGTYHPNRPGRFQPIKVISNHGGSPETGFRWSPARGEAPRWGEYVALNSRPGTEVRLSLVSDSATIAAAPSGETWSASVKRHDGYGRLKSQVSDLPAYLVWDDKLRRLYMFLGPSFDQQPFALVFQTQEDYVRKGR